MIELSERALVAASVDDVWSDLVHAARLEQWIWPARFETTAVVEPWELGRWEIRSEPADLAVLARIVAIEPTRLLRLEWRWAGEDHTTDASIELEPAADASTRVLVHHTGFVSDDDRASHVEGWSNCLQRLVDRYRGVAPAGPA